jgi:hypothetical protein
MSTHTQKITAPTTSELAAFVAGCFQDMNSEIDRIVASAVDGLDEESSAEFCAAAVPAAASATGCASWTAVGTAATQADQHPPTSTQTDDAAADGGDAPHLPPPLALRRRDEGSVDAYDPPAVNPTRLAEGLPPPAGGAPAAGAGPQEGGQEGNAGAQPVDFPALVERALASALQPPEGPAGHGAQHGQQQPSPRAPSGGRGAPAAGKHQKPTWGPAPSSKFPSRGSKAAAAAAAAANDSPQKVQAVLLPREAAAIERHIRRRAAPLPASPPAATAAAARPPSLPPPPHSVPFYPIASSSFVRPREAAPSPPRRSRRAASAPHARRAGAAEEEPAFERLFRLGNARAAARGGASQQRRPHPRRMDEEEWGRVAARLYEEAAKREERLAAKREAQARANSPPRFPGGGHEARGGVSTAGRDDGWGLCSWARPKAAGGRGLFQSGGWAHSSFLDRQAAYVANRDEKLRLREAARQQACEAAFRESCTCELAGVWCLVLAPMQITFH